MISESHLSLIRTKGSKLGRLLLGFLFFASGLAMLFVSGPATVAGLFESLNLPLPLLAAWLTIILKIVAGGALMVGRYVPESAAALIIFTLVATLLGHMSPAVDPTFPTGLLKNLAIVGGLLYVMTFGPGGINIAANSPASTGASASDPAS